MGTKRGSPKKKRAVGRKVSKEIRLKKMLKVLGHNIKICFVKKLIVDDDICVGCFDPETNTVFLHKGLADTLLNETLIHELNEAIKTILHIDINHADLDRMAVAWNQILFDNKLLKLDYGRIPYIDEEISLANPKGPPPPPPEESTEEEATQEQ